MCCQLIRCQYAGLAPGAMAQATSAKRARFPAEMFPDFSIQGMTVVWCSAVSVPVPHHAATDQPEHLFLHVA